MSTSANLGTILRHFATRQESAFVSLRDFTDYLRKYSAKHLEENAALEPFLEISESVLLQQLEDFQSRHEIFILTQANGKTIIVVITYYSVQFANRYKDIVINITNPFPVISDLPKQIPAEAIEKREAAELIQQLQAKQDLKSPLLYCMLMPRDIPSILFPACVPVNFLIRASMAKIRHMLKKEEYHEYFQKKVRISNPGKEIGATSFFNKFLTQNEAQDEKMELDGDYFYYWNQLCYFIRQDFEKVKDRTAEDINVLQAVAISEIWTMTAKEKASKEQKKQAALAELDIALGKAPYFYSMDSILKFTDSKGAMLYGQYNEEELKDFLQRLTTECPDNQLPRLLVFKIDSGARYFIFKDKVFPLVIRLANDAHDVIEKQLTDKWFNTLSNYQKLPEMKDEAIFENTLKKMVKETSPILYSILNANFLTMLNFEMDHTAETNNFRIFREGKLVPYAELLLLKNSSILSNAKTMLPFWYTIPFISWIASLLHRKGKKKEKKEPVEITSDDIPDDAVNPKQDKKYALARQAKELSDYLVPAGSTIDRELDSYLKIWNKMITKEAHQSLTEDVNCLIRDYMRKVIKTVSAQTFTMDRVQTLADTLVKTPNMQKIKEEEALTMYVELYILRLVSNI